MGRHAGARTVLLSPGWTLLREHLRTTRTPLLRVLAWSGVEAVPPLLSGLLIAAATDRGFLAGRPLTGCGWLAVLGLAMLVRAYAARAAFPHVAAVVEPLRDTLVHRVVAGALAAPEPDLAGVARLTEQVETVRQLTATLLRTLRGVGVSLVAAVLGLALLAPIVLPLVLLPLAAGGWLFVRLLGPLVERRRAVVLTDERVAAEAGQTLAGLRDIAACGSQSRVTAALGEAFQAQEAAVRSLGRATALRSLAVALGGRLPVLLVVAAAPWLVGRHWLTTGEVLGVAAYLTQQLEPAVRTLSGTLGGWVLQLSVVLDRLAATGPPAPYEPPTAAPTDRPAAAPAAAPTDGSGLRVHALRYAHGPAAEPVLDGLDLTLEPGEHLAVVGASGAGKSTLASLLAGLRSPDSGEVTLDGVRLDSLPAAERAARLALVPQQAYVFAGTVRENLDWLRPGVRLDDAVELLGAGPLVARLGGLDAELADPAALSAGERQLLALVRTYLSPAPVVVLDEATCHLDPAAEARVEDAFAARPGTLVVIAHRIASALRADRVLLMEGGRARTARHGDLQVLSPFYRELVGHWLGAPVPPSPTATALPSQGADTPPVPRAAVGPDSPVETVLLP